MMLPSGNDAAQSLGIHFGLLILRAEFLNLCKASKSMQVLEKWQADVIKLSMGNYIELENNQEIINAALNAFYREMNRNAAEMKLKDTNFLSAHGMHHDQNYSSALDIALISHQCMKNSTFRQIVKTQKYNCESRLFPGQNGHIYHWQNTNKLLESGYSGLKTGVTPTAGPCLAATIKRDDFKLIVVILNSKTVDLRWSEVQKLVQWAIAKINKVKESELKPKLKKQMLKKLVHI